ncbi:VanW family protein [Bacillus sp. V5-8f]|uniref:VanW family protein n=1 Tax=Bacillus sp. V5-8f TaxID=2053044 RepID=UPI000C77F00B|nr:VanW family protein [Bacillus sp. V5-8f]PLT32384.1 hypothetical protein CUU64_20025 [Bacillus sp. V5-8f]
MKNTTSSYFKFLLLILAGTFFISLFSKFGTEAQNAVFQSNQKFADKTYIGSVNVENLTKKEAKEKIEKAAADWRNNADIAFTFADTKLKVPNNQISFLIDDSVFSAASGMENPLFVSVNEKLIDDQIKKHTSQTLVTNIDIKKLKREIKRRTGTLPKEKIEIRLLDFLKKDSHLKQEVLSSSMIKVDDHEYLDAWLQESKEIKIKENSNFSFLEYLRNAKLDFSDEFLTLSASSLYKAILNTNLQIIERNISRELPEGMEPGFEAKIKQNSMDLILYNPNDYDLTVNFSSDKKGFLKTDIIGYKTPTTYNIRLQNKKYFKPKQIIQYVPDITLVSKPANHPGKQGVSVSIYREITDSNGVNKDSVFVSNDIYLPVNEVVVKEIPALAEPPDAEPEDAAATNENGGNAIEDTTGTNESEKSQADDIADSNDRSENESNLSEKSGE